MGEPAARRLRGDSERGQGGAIGGGGRRGRRRGRSARQGEWCCGGQRCLHEGLHRTGIAAQRLLHAGTGKPKHIRLSKQHHLVAFRQPQVGAATQNTGEIERQEAPRARLRVRAPHDAESRIRVGPHQPRVGQQRPQARRASAAGCPGQRRGDMPGQADAARDDVRARLHTQRVAAPEDVARADLVQGAPARAVRRVEHEAIAGGTQGLSRQREHGGERGGSGTSRQLVDARPRHLAAHGNRAAERRHQDALALAQREVRRGAAIARDDRVKVHNPAPGRSLDPDRPQRPGAAHPARRRQRVEHGSERGEGLHPRPLHLAADEHRDLPELAEREVHLGPAKVARRPRFQIGAQVAQAAARRGHRRQIRHQQGAVAADAEGQGLPGATTEGEHELVVPADQIVVGHRAEALSERTRLPRGSGEAFVAELAQRDGAGLARREEGLGGGKRFGWRRRRGRRSGGGGRRSGR